MSIALVATTIKMRNGIYCCVNHKMKYIADILCIVITLLSNKIHLFTKKCFFQTYATAIFQFFRSFFIIVNVYFEIFIKTHYFCFYITMMKPKAATGGVL